MKRRKVRDHIFVCLLILMIICNISYADENIKYKNQYLAAGISLFVPGGGHFYLGKWKQGLLHLGTESAFIAGTSLLETSSERKEYNIFSILVYETHQSQIFSAYRDARLINNNMGYNNPIENTKMTKLAFSPFNTEYLKRPTVYLAPIVAIGIAYSLRGNKKVGDIKKITIAKKDFDSLPGSLIYEGMMLPFGFSAAFGEECLYRGFLQQEMERLFGKTGGLITASLIFGAMHIGQETRYKNSDYIYPTIATLGGFYFGWIYQRNNYELGEGIAAHGWFTSSFLLANFLLDPENNFFGAGIKFKY